jgi:hypothetical protein
MKKSQIIELVKQIMQEQSATGGGVAGASFTPGVGMNYATPFAFSKKGVKNRATKHQEKMGWTVVKQKKRPYSTKLIDYLDENTY